MGKPYSYPIYLGKGLVSIQNPCRRGLPYSCRSTVCKIVTSMVFPTRVIWPTRPDSHLNSVPKWDRSSDIKAAAFLRRRLFIQYWRSHEERSRRKSFNTSVPMRRFWSDHCSVPVWLPFFPVIETRQQADSVAASVKRWETTGIITPTILKDITIHPTTDPTIDPTDYQSFLTLNPNLYINPISPSLLFIIKLYLIY